MSESTNETATRSQSFLSGEFKKLLPTLVLAVLTALATSWWNTQTTQTDTVRRLENLEQKAERNAQNIAQNSQALQQNAIRVAELSIIQTNTLEQIKDIKQQQAMITQELRIRR